MFVRTSRYGRNFSNVDKFWFDPVNHYVPQKTFEWLRYLVIQKKHWFGYCYCRVSTIGDELVMDKTIFANELLNQYLFRGKPGAIRGTTLMLSSIYLDKPGKTLVIKKMKINYRFNLSSNQKSRWTVSSIDLIKIKLGTLTNLQKVDRNVLNNNTRWRNWASENFFSTSGTVPNSEDYNKTDSIICQVSLSILPLPS